MSLARKSLQIEKRTKHWGTPGLRGQRGEKEPVNGTKKQQPGR